MAKKAKSLVVGKPDTWKLIHLIETEKSRQTTSAMRAGGRGVTVMVSSEHKVDGNWIASAHAIQFIPAAKLQEVSNSIYWEIT